MRCNEDLIRIKGKWIRDINSFEPSSVLSVKRSVVATRYATFQFNLVMRILTTNTFLFLINRREDNRCTFCGNEAESLTHLFLTCRHVETFFSDIMRYLLKSGIGHLNSKQKIFGDIDSQIITHVVTLAKLIIYEARRSEVRPKFAHFQSRLKYDIETERLIATKNNTIECFDKKWNDLH